MNTQKMRIRDEGFLTLKMDVLLKSQNLPIKAHSIQSYLWLKTPQLICHIFLVKWMINQIENKDQLKLAST